MIGRAEPWTEKQFDGYVFLGKNALAKSLGWHLNYHVLRSKGSQPGFPDRVLVRDRVIFAELKRDGEKPTERQRDWLTGLAAAGAEVYLWRPADLDEIATVLSRHWLLERDRRMLYTVDKALWRPGSLWMPSGMRVDEVPAQLSMEAA